MKVQFKYKNLEKDIAMKRSTHDIPHPTVHDDHPFADPVPDRLAPLTREKGRKFGAGFVQAGELFSKLVKPKEKEYLADSHEDGENPFLDKTPYIDPINDSNNPFADSAERGLKQGPEHDEPVVGEIAQESPDSTSDESLSPSREAERRMSDIIFRLRVPHEDDFRRGGNVDYGKYGNGPSGDGRVTGKVTKVDEVLRHAVIEDGNIDLPTAVYQLIRNRDYIGLTDVEVAELQSAKDDYYAGLGTESINQ